MCEAATVCATDTVFEIGPGTGALTVALLKTGARVVAIETDGRASLILEERFAAEIKNEQFTIVKADIKKVTFFDVGLHDHQFKVVANIPYYLSGLLFRTCLQQSIQPSDLVFLVQKEFAKRASAKNEKGDKTSILSHAVQVYGDTSYVRSVSRGNFTPPPKVDSAVIAVRNITRDNFDAILHENHFFTLLHLGFGRKRKQLLGNLVEILPRNTLLEIFTILLLPTDIRAEDLSLTQWLSLARAIEQNPAAKL